jgi:hypothetical protein
MFGLETEDGCAIGVVMIFAMSLAWYLFGVEIAIICGGFTVLGIVLNLTPLNELEPERFHKTRPLSPCSRSRLASADDIAYISPVYIRRDVVVIPDSPVSFRHPRRRSSKHLAGVRRSMSLDGEL